MVAHAWQGIIMVIMAVSLLLGCASSPYVGTGAAVGGGLGALAGAAIGNRNPWAGALIGGLVGTGLGAAGGYVVQQRQTAPPAQGYYPPAQPGYSAPPAYGYRTPAAPGPSYGSNTPAPGPAPGSGHLWNTPAPVTPPADYGNGSVPPAQNYSQSPQASVRTPIVPAPYYSQQPVE